MGLITRLYNYDNGTLGDGDQVQAEFDQIIATLGDLDNANIKALAAIVGTKLADAPSGVPTAKINDLAVTKAKVAAAAISQDKLENTEYTNAGGLTYPASTTHDTGISSATRQGIAVWFTGAGQLVCGMGVVGGTWRIHFISDSGLITINAGELHFLHIAKL